MYGQPYSSYYSPRPVHPWGHGVPQYAQPYAQPRRNPYYGGFDIDHARALAEARKRRSQWLPDEDSDEDEMMMDGYMDPRERAYLQGVKLQEAAERQREQERERLRLAEEARRRQIEEEKRKAKSSPKEGKRARSRSRTATQRQSQAQQQPKPQSTPTPTPAPSQTTQTQPASKPPTPRPQSPPQQASTQTPSSSASASAPAAEQQPPVDPEKLASAATTIQQRWRIHKAYKALNDVCHRFEDVKRGFVYPSVIDFVKPSPPKSSEEMEVDSERDRGIVSVRAVHPPSDFTEANEEEDSTKPKGKLAYTSTNWSLHQYTDTLDKLLLALDAIESWGDAGVRSRRREEVKMVEREAARVDWYWREAWSSFCQSQSQSS